LSFKGLHRLKPRSIKKAEPTAYGILDFSIGDNLVYWCLFLFVFFLVARKSNLFPTNFSDIAKGRFLSKEGVRYFGD
jgi:hypothetical protein